MLDPTASQAGSDGTDLVITGEGSLDAQSLRGKTPAGVARRRGPAGVPVVAVCGRLELTRDQLRQAGIREAFSLAELEPDPARSMDNHRQAADRARAAAARPGRGPAEADRDRPRSAECSAQGQDVAVDEPGTLLAEIGDHLGDLRRRRDVDRRSLCATNARTASVIQPVSVTGGWTTFAVIPERRRARRAADIV